MLHWFKLLQPSANGQTSDDSWNPEWLDQDDALTSSDLFSEPSATPESWYSMALGPTKGAQAPISQDITALSTSVVSASGSGLVFDNTFDSSCSAEYIACITAAEKELSTLFTNSLTVSVSFHEKNTGKGFELTNGGEKSKVVTYSQLKAALPSSDVLPATDPAPAGSTWKVSYSYGRMLGLTNLVGPSDSVTLNTYFGWTFGQDVINGVIHELSEGGMGRTGGLGGSTETGDWRAMDLFRYNSSGVLDDSNGRDGQTTSFSSDGGKTMSSSVGLLFNNQYNTSGVKVNGADTDDWRGNHVFGGTQAGETLTLTQTELDVMAALGWRVSLPQEEMTKSGNWETPTDWNDGFMPITPEDALISGPSAVAATLTSAVTVNSIGTNPSSSLEISDGGNLTATNGTVLNPERTLTWASGSLGAIKVDVGSTLTIGDMFDNQGSTTVGVILSSAGGNGDLVLSGTVTLDGGGTLYLGQQSSTFQADSTGSITGLGSFLVTLGGLKNVDNTIVGGGTIDLSSFDNQTSGVVDANQSEGNALQIITSTFTNEGALKVESRSVLDLGQDGGTGSLTNTGVVALEGQGNLAISGAFSITGTGDIGFEGAGAEITSDGHAPATFTNESRIKASSSGQIGDAGVLASNDLTFDNSGSTVASGAGVTLTLDTGANTVSDAGGMLEAESGATLAIDSNVDTGETSVSIPPAPGGTIEAGAGGTVTLSAAVARGLPIVDSVSGQVVIAGGTLKMLVGASVSVPVKFTAGGTLDIFGSAAVSVSGSNGAIAAVAGDAITLTSGTGDTVTGTGFTVNGGSGVGLKIVGKSDVVDTGANDSIVDGGSSTEFRVQGNVAALKISGLGSDPTGIIDLLGGVGGYTTAAGAFAALVSDGSGGSKLSLGFDGSIDIAGVPKSSLSASNFKIG
jgi:hypothetical protein